MSARTRWLAFAAFFVAALVLLMPMRVALDWFGLDRSGLSARDATGTVWSGRIEEAALGPVPIGDVKAALAVMPLFIGHARVAMSRTDPDPVTATVDVSYRGFAIRRATGRFAAGRLLAPAPVASIDLTEVSAAFANGRCVAASGQAGATLAGPLAVTLPALSGQVSCENEWVLIPLAGGGARIDLRIAMDGRYRIDMQVAAVNEAVAAALQASGFRPAPGGYAIHRAGAF